MRRKRLRARMYFSVKFGGPRSCVPQTNWIRNACGPLGAIHVGSATGSNSSSVGRVAASRAAGFGLLRAMTDATRLHSRAVPALLACRSRRRASPPASTPNSRMSMPATAWTRSILSSCQSNHASMSASQSRRRSSRSRRRRGGKRAFRPVRHWRPRGPFGRVMSWRRRVHSPTERSIFGQARCQKINAGQTHRAATRFRPISAARANAWPIWSTPPTDLATRRRFPS